MSGVKSFFYMSCVKSFFYMSCVKSAGSVKHL